MIRDQFILDVHDELIVDNFAGGGGASTGIELALGRHVDIAVNHDRQALAMHEANHPQTHHVREDVFHVDIVSKTGGRPVGLAWFSPDCKHFSKAKGGKPRNKKIRGLAWVVIKWVNRVKPRVIILENVEEFRGWTPVDRAGTPSKWRPGWFFHCFTGALRRRGYVVDWRELRACDYGAPTIRKRLFLIARCDGKPVTWPEPTHGAPDSVGVKAKQLKPWRTAADCIDFTLPCPSIFERKRPLAPATCRRIAKGIVRFVIEAANPFIIPVTHAGGENRGHAATEPFKTVTGAHRGEMALVSPHVTKFRAGSVGTPVDAPLHTVTAGGDQARPGTANAMGLIAVSLAETAHGEADRNGKRRGPGIPNPAGPMNTATASGNVAVVASFLAKHYGGMVGIATDGPTGTITATDHHSLVTANLVGAGGPSYQGKPRAVTDPAHTLTTENHTAVVSAQLVGCGGRAGQSRPRDVSEAIQTITAKGDTALVTSSVVKLRGDPETHAPGQPDTEPLHTVSSQGNHFGEVRAFLTKYYGCGEGSELQDPMHTVTSVDRFGLVTIHGEQFAITDIGLRMLQPRELFNAQGFPAHYIIGDQSAQRLTLSKSDQVRMCGNSVCPPLAQALVSANVPEMAVWTKKESKSA